MANEIQTPKYIPARTTYALVFNSVGQVWRTTSSTFVSYVTATLANYAIALTEQGTASGRYMGDFPAAPAGKYSVVVFDRAGGSAAETDNQVASGDVDWTGTAVASLGTQTGSSAGSGAFAVTVKVTSDGVTPIPGATVRISGNQTAWGTTDNSGNIGLSLNAGSVTLSITAGGYTYNATTQTITGAGNWSSGGGTTLTVTMTVTPSASPSSDPAKTTCYLTVRDASLAKKSGVVFKFKLVNPQQTVDAWSQTLIQSATSDSNGLVQIALAVNTQWLMISPDGTSLPFTTGTAPTFALPEIVGTF